MSGKLEKAQQEMKIMQLQLEKSQDDALQLWQKLTKSEQTRPFQDGDKQVVRLQEENQRLLQEKLLLGRQLAHEKKILSQAEQELARAMTKAAEFERLYKANSLPETATELQQELASLRRQKWWYENVRDMAGELIHEYRTSGAINLPDWLKPSDLGFPARV